MADGRIEDRDPGPVGDGELGVVTGLVLAPVGCLLCIQARRGVEDCHAVAHELCVADHRGLHSLGVIIADETLAVSDHEIGCSDHRDVLEHLECAEAGASG